MNTRENICHVSVLHLLFQFIASHVSASREVTGKNKLLQKIREMKGNGDRYPNECMDPSHSVPENVLEKLNAAQPQAAESACGQETHKQGGDNQSSYVQFGYRMTEMETPPTSQQGPIKKPEQQRCAFFSLFILHISNKLIF